MRPSESSSKDWELESAGQHGQNIPVVFERLGFINSVTVVNIVYISHAYVPSRRASSVQVMKMCAACAHLGHRVTLLTMRSRRRTEPGVSDIFDYYGVPRRFTVEPIARPAIRGGGILHGLGLAATLRARRRELDLVYCRSLVGAAIAIQQGLPFVLEAHSLPEDKVLKGLWRFVVSSPRLRRLAVISHALANDLARSPLHVEGIEPLVAPDAADLPTEGPVDDGEPPAGLAASGPHVGYVGNLYPGRGVETILDLARRLPDCGFHLVGGSTTDLRHWSSKNPSPNVVFHGFVPPSQLGRFYRRFAAVLMPFASGAVTVASGGDSSRWMSPLKMFEYMSSGVPIISSDLPVLREVLEHERSALLVPADDMNAWATAIRRIIDEPALGRRLGATAQNAVRDRFTWEARAKSILAGLPDGNDARR